MPKTVKGHVEVFTFGNNKSINLFHGGDAVNFVYKGVNGPFIYGVQASLIVSALRLAQGRFKNDNSQINELPITEQRTIAKLWVKAFERKKYDKINNLPSKNEYLIKREEHLYQLNQRFSDFSEHYQLQGINGLPGMGKTQLAKGMPMHMNTTIKEYGGLTLLLDMVSQFKDLADKLRKEGFSIEDYDIENDMKIIVKTVYNILTSIKKWLIIFDNVEDFENLKNFYLRLHKKLQDTYLSPHSNLFKREAINDR